MAPARSGCALPAQGRWIAAPMGGSQACKPSGTGSQDWDPQEVARKGRDQSMVPARSGMCPPRRQAAGLLNPGRQPVQGQAHSGPGGPERGPGPAISPRTPSIGSGRGGSPSASPFRTNIALRRRGWLDRGDGWPPRGGASKRAGCPVPRTSFLTSLIASRGWSQGRTRRLGRGRHPGGSLVSC